MRETWATPNRQAQVSIYYPTKGRGDERWAEGRFPVMLMPAVWKRSPREATTTCTDLARKGYVVVSVSAEDDLRFVEKELVRLQPHVKLERVELYRKDGAVVTSVTNSPEK